MKKLVLIIATTLFGWLGWWLGEGFGVMAAYLLSVVGSLAGVVVGCYFNRHYLD